MTPRIHEITPGSIVDYYGTPAIKSTKRKHDPNLSIKHWWITAPVAEAVVVAEQLSARHDRLFPPEAARGIPRIYLVGCGDSLYAGMAARLAFEQLTHIATEAVPALEFSRYLVDYVPPGSLVITISVSGGVSRTMEAAEWAKRRECWVIGLTGRANSKLAPARSNREREHVIDPDQCQHTAN